MNEPARSVRTLIVASIAVAGLALAVGVVARASDASFGDEALALLRYHANLAGEGAFVWSPDGERTIGALSPLQFTLLAALQVFVHSPALALVSGSVLSGLVGLAACFVLARGAARRARDSRLAFDGLVALVIGLAAVPLAVQFTSGLETTLALAMTGIFTWMWSQSERVDVPIGGAALGGFGAALFATRADLGIYGLGVPLLVALFAREAQRRQALVALGVASAGVASIALWLQWAHGIPVPLAFVLEPAPFRPLGAWSELLHWLAVTAPLWGLVVLELALRRGAPRVEPRVWDHAFVLATVAFLIDATVGALAVDGSSLRFLLATLPPLVFLAARAAVGLRRWAEWRGKRVPTAPFVLLAVATILAPLPALWEHVGLAREELAAGRVGRYAGMLAPERCERWPGLAELAPLAPPRHDPERGPLVVACAPAGEVGAALPLASVIDLSGVHDRRIAHAGFDARELCTVRRPDWVWLPAPGHAAWARALRGEPEFAREYELFSLASAHAPLDVAVRRDSAYGDELRRIAAELVERR